MISLLTSNSNFMNNVVYSSPIIMAILLYFVATSVLGNSKSLKRLLIHFGKRGALVIGLFYVVTFILRYLAKENFIDWNVTAINQYLSFATMFYLGYLGIKFFCSTHKQLRVLWAIIPFGILLIDKLSFLLK